MWCCYRPAASLVHGISQAALLLAIVLGGELFLHPAPPVRATAVDTSPDTALDGAMSQVSAAGLIVSLQVAGGPYFRGELLPVDLTLVNNRGETLTLMGAAGRSCSSALSVAITVGGVEHYPAPSYIGHCPFLMTNLGPSKTLRMRVLLPLSASGEVTLIARALFLAMRQEDDGNWYPNGNLDLLNGHWPAVTLPVAPMAPANRMLTLHAGAGVITVQAPPGAQGHVVYTFNASCGAGGGTEEIGGYGDWLPAPTGIITLAECPGTNPVWGYYVAAPGYAIASGVAPESCHRVPDALYRIECS